MKILVVGSGGREHCLAWKLAQSKSVEKVYIAPGNGGTENVLWGENIAISSDDIEELLKFARHEQIGLTVVGPEAPLVAGIANEFRDHDLPVFGPGFKGAQLEGSKSFAKEFMAKHDLPTADFRIFDDIDAAESYLMDVKVPMVIKASGLAAGKGVLVSREQKDNLEALDLIMRQKAFGPAGSSVVIEELLDGFEASLMIITDGRNHIKLPYSQDHKRQLDDDEGPNTGGMGVFCPSGKITREMDARIDKEILEPLLQGIHHDFRDDFRGMLYVGLMITSKGPKILEFNVRFGDPEAQAVLPLMDFDLADLLLKCANGRLPDNILPAETEKKCLGVVIASEGYPGSYKKGVNCDFLDEIDSKPEFTVFHAGTKRSDGQLLSTGGRVAAVCSIGESFNDVRNLIYGELESYDTSGFFFRRDLAKGQP